MTVETPDDLLLAKADPNQLEMAILNLSVNARDAMPEEGTLRITATEERVGLVIDPSCGPGAMFGFRLLIPASAWTGNPRACG